MTVKKMLPCSPYDVQGLQSWLDELALEGLFFQKFSRAIHCARFQEGVPRPVRYRLDPIGRNWDGLERRENYAQMGWTFVDTLPRMYCIFSCEDPDAPELHSDPATLAYALTGTIRKQIRFQCIWGLAGLLFVCALLFFIRAQLLKELILMEHPRTVFQLGFSLFVFLLNAVIPAVQLRKLMKTRRALEQGFSPAAGRRWNWTRYTAIYFCVVVPLLLALFFSIPSHRPEYSALDWETLSHPWPTLAQLEALGPHPLEEEPETDSYQGRSHSWFVPVQEYASIDWRTNYVTDTGDTLRLERPYTLWLSIQYDQARSPWAAWQAYQLRLDEQAQELRNALTYDHSFRVTDLQEFQTVDFPGLDRLETVRFRRAGQDAWLFAALRETDVLVVEFAGYAPLEPCLELFLQALEL